MSHRRDDPDARRALTNPRAVSLTRYRGVRSLVLGANGFIGRWVARALACNKAHVVLAVRDRAEAEQVFRRYSVSGEIRPADLGDPASVRRLLHAVHPEIVFNLAGYGVDRSERNEATAYTVNGDLVAWIAESTADLSDTAWPGQRLIHAGSALEYGRAAGDLSEETPPDPTTLYGLSKLEGTRNLTRICRARNLAALTARLFTVYGPGEHTGRLLPSLEGCARSGRPLELTSGRQRRDFAYVADVAEGLLRLGLVQTTPDTVVNLASGQLTTVRAFAERAARIFDIPGSLLRFDALPLRAEEMSHDDVNVSRFRRLTGWVLPTDPSTGLHRSRAFAESLDGV